MHPDVFYDDGGMVRVTRSQVIIAGVVYPLHGITSVRVQLAKPKNGWLTVLMLLATVLMIGGIFAASENPFCLIVGAIGVVTCAVIMFLRTREKRYQLILGTAGGERPALESPHEPAIIQPYQAIMHALSTR